MKLSGKDRLFDSDRKDKASNSQILLGFIALALIFALPSLSSSYSNDEAREAGGYLRGSDLNRNSWEFLVIADLDTQSKDGESKKLSFYSLLLDGTIVKDPATGRFSIKWGSEKKLVSGHNEAGRGMELSELVSYRGKLYAVDDRTGIVFEVTKDPKVVPTYIIMEGDGSTDKGMKLEWATVKDNLLYLGSFGKEYTAKDGSILNTNNLWVTTVDPEGRMEHLDWSRNYDKIRDVLGASRPGYVIHEAANWSPRKRQWVFLPRRVSSLAYDEDLDEKMGSNKMVIADEHFTNVVVREAGSIIPEHGFSSFKFLPGSNDDILVALKSVEEAATQKQATYITIFNIKGEVLMEETLLPSLHKYEGLEFTNL